MLSKGIVVAGLALFAFGGVVKFSQEMGRRQLERYQFIITIITITISLYLLSYIYNTYNNSNNNKFFSAVYDGDIN